MFKTNALRFPAIKLHTKRWRKRGSIICLFIILLVCAQSKGYTQSNMRVEDSAQIIRKAKPPVLISATRINITTPDLAKPAILPPGFYTKTIGYFCKKEIQIEKAVKLPVRFRLGSVAYTDKMENKNNFKVNQQ